MPITTNSPTTSFRNYYVFANQMVNFKMYRTVLPKKPKYFELQVGESLNHICSYRDNCRHPTDKA
ncbi:hypothetical protein C0V77_01190 [Emticicia sp. TH156]|nr:hypothetical protein C0V77_01190 [Emticicia sp. TH156]